MVTLLEAAAGAGVAFSKAETRALRSVSADSTVVSLESKELEELGGVAAGFRLLTWDANLVRVSSKLFTLFSKLAPGKVLGTSTEPRFRTGEFAWGEVVSLGVLATKRQYPSPAIIKMGTKIKGSSLITN